MNMDYRLETEIWRAAQQNLPAARFVRLIAEGVRLYKRPAGYFQLERVHDSDVGEAGLAALKVALREIGAWTLPKGWDDFVSLRAPLRAHLSSYLQRYLITRSLASGAVLDNRFAGDLGL
jgi:hypothetical protein